MELIKHNKLARAITIALPLVFLAGCSSDSNDDATTETTPPPSNGPVIIFDVANGNVPYPNNINGFDQDGTLAVFGESQWAQSIDNGDLSESPNAYWNYYGSQDGWGASTPMIINLEGGAEVDPATLTGDTVKLFRSVDGGNAFEALTYGEDFRAIVSDSGSINIEPLHPYDGGTRYLFALTAGIADTNGEPLTASSSYSQLLNTSNNSEHSQNLKRVISDLEAAGIEGSTIVYGADFTVTSTLDILRPVVDKFLNEYAQSTEITNIQAADTAYNKPFQTNALVSDAIHNALKANGTPVPPLDTPPEEPKNYTLYTAEINLPNYLDTPELGINCSFHPNLVDEQGNPAPGVTLPDNMNDFRIAPEKYCQAAFSYWQDSHGKPLTGETAADIKVFAEPSENPIKVAISVPDSNKFQPPYKTFMYAHGYGSSKDEITTIASDLAEQGYAMVAIDQPVHGDRAVDINGDGISDLDAGTRRTDFVMSDNLLTTRSFLTQVMLDYLGVRYAISNGVVDTINNSATPLLDTDNVHMAGLSLGGIATTSISALLRDTQNRHPSSADKLDLKTTSMFVPGGGLASIILQSPALAGQIETDLLDTGMFRLEMARLLGSYNPTEDTTSDRKVAILDAFDARYRSLTEEDLANIPGIEDDQVRANAEALAAAFEVLVGADSEEKLTSFSDFEHQAWLDFKPRAQIDAQSVVDAGDPMTLSTVFRNDENQDEPLFLVESVGDGSNTYNEADIVKALAGIKPWNPGDFIIVNQVHEMPLSGTDPLIRTMGLDILSCDLATTDDGETCVFSGTVRGAARYGFGTHMSSAVAIDLSDKGKKGYLLPNDTDVHNSIIEGMLSFAESDGKKIELPNKGSVDDPKISETLLLDESEFPASPDYKE